MFECSDDAAPGISLIDARRGFGIKRDGMIPGVPVDWEEAVLRPYVRVFLLFYTLPLNSSLVIPVIVAFVLSICISRLAF